MFLYKKKLSWVIIGFALLFFITLMGDYNTKPAFCFFNQPAEAVIADNNENETVVKTQDPAAILAEESARDNEDITPEELAKLIAEDVVTENQSYESTENVAEDGNQTDDEIGLELTAKAAALIDTVSGQQLYSKNADVRLPMASVTKIMTMLLAAEAVEKGQVQLSDIVTASENASEMGGSQIYLEVGEKMSFEDMLISIAAGSANDSCVAIAEYLCGSHDEFVAAMNEKATQLGLKNTNFINAYGLPAENHYTSAADMAIILKTALQNDLFKKITAIKTYELRGGQFILNNTNKLLWWYDGTVSGKTGWTNEAGYCLATCVERDGLSLIAVVLGVPETRGHFRESMKIYDYGFAEYKAVKLAEKDELISTVIIDKGNCTQVNVIAEKDASFVALKTDNEEYEYTVEVPQVITAPVEQGQVLGKLVISKQGQKQGTVNLVAESTVDKLSLAQETKRTIINTFDWK